MCGPMVNVHHARLYAAVGVFFPAGVYILPTWGAVIVYKRVLLFGYTPTAAPRKRAMRRYTALYGVVVFYAAAGAFCFIAVTRESEKSENASS